MFSASRYIWTTEYIHPPEADRLASAFGHARAQMNQSASMVDQINARLAQGWEGTQATRFLDTAQNVPLEIRSCAEWCSSQEHKFQTITVAIRRRVLASDDGE
jgi:hypothetical protein